MKLFLKAACTAFVLTVILSLLPFQAACADIPDEVFRLHILANSDNREDQALKLQVRDRVLALTENLYRQADTKEEAEALTKAHLQEIADAAAAEITAQGCDYSVKAEICRMYFGTRHYDDYTLPAGEYDALRLTIGAGKGHNWWCVMFPSLCVGSHPDSKAREVFSDSEYQVVKGKKQKYRFYLVEFFQKIGKSFS